MDWLRWWHGTVTDPKFQRVARMSGASVGEVLAVWACLLECASEVPECDASVTVRDASRDDCDASVTDVTQLSRGDVTNFDCADHDVLLGFSDGKSAAVVAALTDRGLIVGGRLASWNERQPALRDSAGKRQSASAARSAAYRARKKAELLASRDGRDGGVTRHESHVIVTPEKTRQDKSKNPPYPPAGGEPQSFKAEPVPKAATKPAEKSDRSKPKRALPLPFLMTNEMLTWAAEKVPAVKLDRETEKFIDYWTGQGGAKADWKSTWRNWMRRAQDDLERRGLAGATKHDPNDTTWIDEDDGL